MGCGAFDGSSEVGSSDTGRTSTDVELRCGRESTPTAADASFQLKHARTGTAPIQIVTTIGMVTDIVRQVAGEEAEVNGLMSEGVDPHLYNPTRDDVQKVMSAEVIFYSGLNLEARLQDTFSGMAREGKPVFAVTDGLSRGFLHHSPDFEGHPDPHVWGDVAAWSLCVDYVAKALSAYDPAHADTYVENARAYRSQLNQLNDYVTQVIGSIPEEQRILVTAHDAFGYFSCAYQIPVKSAQGITTESEAGVNDVNRLVDLLVARKLPAIFVESSVNQKNMLAVVEGAGQRGQTVAIGGELYSDAMGTSGTYEGTYIGMLDHNATTIARALGGNAPGFGKMKAEETKN